MNDLFKTNPYFLAKRDDPDTSKEAANALDTTKLEEAVYNFIKSCGDDGATIAQCVIHFKPTSQSSITSRPAALERKGLIYYAGDTRTGASNRQQRVIRVNRRNSNQDVYYSEGWWVNKENYDRRQPEVPTISLKEENEQLKEKIRELESVINQRRFLEDQNKLFIEQLRSEIEKGEK